MPSTIPNNGEGKIIQPITSEEEEEENANKNERYIIGR